MGMTNNLCNSCTNSGCEFQSGIVRTKCAFYMPPRGEQMTFPNTFDEFAKVYGFKDKDEVYTNGSELIPVFRVKQWLEHISTTKCEARLKSDMVAMLEDLSREINPIKECEQQIFGKESWNFVGKCQDVIKSKINKLREG